MGAAVISVCAGSFDGPVVVPRGGGGVSYAEAGAATITTGSPPGGVLELAESIEDGLRREVREETGVDIEPETLSGVYKNMNRGIVARVFRCKATGGQVATNEEVTAFRWADEDTIRQLTSEACAVRLLDALRSDTTPVIRHHDGTSLL